MIQPDSDQIPRLADMLLEVLRIARARNEATPDLPMNHTTICERYNNKFRADIEAGGKREITDVDIRAAVGILTGERGEPVASVSGTDGGYFYCTSAKEWEEYGGHLLKRAAKIFAHYHKPMTRLRASQTELIPFAPGQEVSEAEKLLIREFGAVRI